MDQKSRDAFKARQLAALRMVSSAKAEASSSSRPSGEPKPKKPKTSGAPSASGGAKSAASGAQKPRPKHNYELDRQMSNRFAILAKVVKYLKQRFHEGLLDPLCIEDLLEEARLTDTPATVKGWLASEALPDNPKVETVQKNGARCFVFKPCYPKVRDRHSLINLLESFAAEGGGGVLLEHLLESAPNAMRLVDQLVESGDAVAIPLVNQRRLTTPATSAGGSKDGGESSSKDGAAAGTTTRQTNKVVFSSQRQYGLPGVDDKLVAMWRTIEPGGAEMALAISGEQLPDKGRVKGKRGRPPSKKTGADGLPSFRQTNVHLANTGVLINFSK